MIAAAKNLLSYARSHPTGRKQPLATWGRILAWQARSRLLSGPHVLPWIGTTRLVAERGMSGVTGNLYFGLHEFADMAFMLHFLRADDLLLDIGANAGTYTVLAAGVRKARVKAFEPDPEAAQQLSRNIGENGLGALVEVHHHALGSENGMIGFTKGLGAMNHVTNDDAEISQRLPVRRLDDVIEGHLPVRIKIDVEGHEDAAFSGAEKVLALPSLLAVEAETVSEASHARFLGLGFVRRYYDPESRALSETPVVAPANNRLYVREPDRVAARLAASPPINVFGWRL